MAGDKGSMKMRYFFLFVTLLITGCWDTSYTHQEVGYASVDAVSHDGGEFSSKEDSGRVRQRADSVGSDTTAPDVGGREVPECAVNFDCDDDNLCTLDTCIQFGCKHEPLSEEKRNFSCDDTPCTESWCEEGKCTIVTEVCDDGISCTVESCDPATNTCVIDNKCDMYSVGISAEPVDFTKYYHRIRVIHPVKMYVGKSTEWQANAYDEATPELEEKGIKKFGASLHLQGQAASHGICDLLISADNEGKYFPTLVQVFLVDRKTEEMELVPHKDIKISFSSGPHDAQSFNEGKSVAFQKWSGVTLPGYLKGDPFEEYGYYAVPALLDHCKPFVF